MHADVQQSHSILTKSRWVILAKSSSTVIPGVLELPDLRAASQQGVTAWRAGGEGLLAGM